MAQSLIACPLCSAASFSSISALCLSLVNVASKWLRCTMCEEELRGLDKLTIHLLSHLVHTSDFKRYLANDDSCSGTRLVLNQQPLNLVLSQNDQSKQPVSDGKNQFSMQTENIIERPSLKIDDEVMIFFNSNECNKGFQMKSGEINVVRALDRETPSSSGLPKFSINFDKTTSDQSENINSEKQSITGTSSGICFEEDSRNETLHYLFPTKNSNEGSINQNVSVPVKDNELQMDVSDNNNKEKELHNSLLDMESILDTRNETRCTLMHSDTENQTGNKSSYLSPKGERVLGFRCDICSLVFPDEHILSMHRQLIHIELHSGPSEPTSYKCHLCSKSFVMKGSLMVHMRVAHFGGAVVARLVEAKQLETDAVSPDSAQFICTICNKGFQKEQQLAQHEKLHDGKQCDVCFKTFTTKYFLRKHKRLHTGEMPYQCSQCNKSFTFQQSYHKHLLYHSDDKPYSCADCGRAFKELSTLHNHQRIHTGEKPFSCETCGKCFRQRVSYLVHRRIHTGVMPYRCQDCGKTFRYKVSERTHKCSTSTPGVSEVANTEAKLESLSTFGSKEKETQVNSGDSGMAKPAPSLEAEQQPMHEMFPGPADFFSLVMSPSPSDRLQHLSLTSDSVEDSRSPTQRESIDSEALKQLLYDVADYT